MAVAWWTYICLQLYCVQLSTAKLHYSRPISICTSFRMC